MKINEMRKKEVYKKVNELTIGDFFQYGKLHELYVLVDDYPYIIFNLEKGYPEKVEEYTKVLPVEIEINIIE